MTSVSSTTTATKMNKRDTSYHYVLFGLNNGAVIIYRFAYTDPQATPGTAARPFPHWQTNVLFQTFVDLTTVQPQNANDQGHEKYMQLNGVCVLSLAHGGPAAADASRMKQQNSISCIEVAPDASSHQHHNNVFYVASLSGLLLRYDLRQLTFYEFAHVHSSAPAAAWARPAAQSPRHFLDPQQQQPSPQKGFLAPPRPLFQLPLPPPVAAAESPAAAGETARPRAPLWGPLAAATASTAAPASCYLYVQAPILKMKVHWDGRSPADHAHHIAVSTCGGLYIYYGKDCVPVWPSGGRSLEEENDNDFAERFFAEMDAAAATTGRPARRTAPSVTVFEEAAAAATDGFLPTLCIPTRSLAWLQHAPAAASHRLGSILLYSRETIAVGDAGPRRDAARSVAHTSRLCFYSLSEQRSLHEKVVATAAARCDRDADEGGVAAVRFPQSGGERYSKVITEITLSPQNEVLVSLTPFHIPYYYYYYYQDDVDAPRPADPRCMPSSFEYMLSGSVRALRRLQDGPPPPPLRVRFSHAGPAAAAMTEEMGLCVFTITEAERQRPPHGVRTPAADTTVCITTSLAAYGPPASPPSFACGPAYDLFHAHCPAALCQSLFAPPAEEAAAAGGVVAVWGSRGEIRFWRPFQKPPPPTPQRQEGGHPHLTVGGKRGCDPHARSGDVASTYTAAVRTADQWDIYSCLR
ncbi:hypothetical protein STCU_11312 [Strigomonas culicis]|uniref:Uncharacterized protein n=1 Tax=Strigomonas culicis TaxID=28005 RepID=S9TJ39_9TRYP|nr:hypothetical protein STCU_11312 [Strigomonas culicis]|eukprot:EPY16403.1 hypothetical protein STCU_11312 [Strigomonas culicis]